VFNLSGTGRGNDWDGDIFSDVFDRFH
jgi:hypothetical protein